MDDSPSDEKAKQLVNKFLEIPRRKWVIWVGAGISAGAPSKLPLGNSLTDFSIGHIFGHKVLEKSEKIWEKAQKYIQDNTELKNISAKPRLETILNIVNDVEVNAENLEYSFMQGFKGFKSAPFNQNHLGIASLLSQGATIITCNFDLCIETAYSFLKSGKDELVRKKQDRIMLSESKNDPGVGKIWHYHGSVDEIADLGATINTIKQGFSDTFGAELDNMFTKAQLTLFFGYSFSDAFDFAPYFNSLPLLKYPNNKAYFYQYKNVEEALFDGTVTEDDKTEVIRISNYLKCFKDAEPIYGNTSEFIPLLTPSILRLDDGDPAYDWKQQFLKQIVPTDLELVQPFLILRLANTLGIHADYLSPSAFKKANSFKGHYPDNEFYDTLAVACRRKGQGKLEKQYHSLKENDQVTGDFLGYYYSLGDYEKAKEYAESLDEIREEAEDSTKELTWKPYTSMSVYCRPLVNKYLNNPFIKKISSDDQKAIEDYLDLLELLSNRKLKNVTYINQVVTMQRFRLLFLALLFGEREKPIEKQIEEEILFLYREESSIEGFISIFRDISVKFVYLAKFHHDFFQYKNAWKYANHSFQIAQITGDMPGKKRAFQLFLAIIGNACFSLLWNIPRIFSNKK